MRKKSYRNKVYYEKNSYFESAETTTDNFDKINNKIQHHITSMAQKQQFQLKLAIRHHSSLKTSQLFEFLENQANQFLTNDLPHSLTSDHFLTIFQSPNDDSIDYTEYVGLLLLYSSSSLQSFEFVKEAIPDESTMNDLFMIIVEMDNTDKKSNAIGDEGMKLCEKHNYQFVKLTLYNSEDLVTILHRNLYELIENYYFPNQEQKPSKKQYQSQYQLQYTSQPAFSQQQSPETKSPKKYKKIIATKQDKKSLQKLLDKASQLRESRNDYISQEQQEIDEAIDNVEEVLNNLNQNIHEKVKSNWYTSLKHTLFSPLQKNSTSFAKIKLTQQFIDEDDEDDEEIPGILSTIKSKAKKSISYPARPSRDAIINKFINTNKKKEPLLKIILAVVDSVIVELDIFQDTNFNDLALVALRKVGINETEHNFNLMKQIITGRIQEYVKQLVKAVKYIEKVRIQQRSYINKKKQSTPYDNYSSGSRSVKNIVNSQFYSYK